MLHGLMALTSLLIEVLHYRHAYILHLLAEMYDSIGIHELSRMGKELHLKLPNTC